MIYEVFPEVSWTDFSLPLFLYEGDFDSHNTLYHLSGLCGAVLRVNNGIDLFRFGMTNRRVGVLSFFKSLFLTKLFLLLSVSSAGVWGLFFLLDTHVRELDRGNDHLRREIRLISSQVQQRSKNERPFFSGQGVNLYSSLFEVLMNELPNDIALSHMELSDRREVTIIGDAMYQSSVYNFYNFLKKNYSSVFLDYVKASYRLNEAHHSEFKVRFVVDRH